MDFILSLETSGRVCSVALHSQHTLIDSEVVKAEHAHSRELAVLIGRLLKRNKGSLQAVAVSGGPGSYTGLRIGVSVAKGMCAALGIPLIAINTLELMVDKAVPLVSASSLLCPMIDARRMEVYCMVKDTSFNVRWPEQNMIVSAHTFDELLEGSEVVFFGDGSGKCREVIRHPHARFIEVEDVLATDMVRMADKYFRDKKFVDVAAYEPNYLKPVYTTTAREQKV